MSNYPPGVTGNECEIAGHSWEYEGGYRCYKCGGHRFPAISELESWLHEVNDVFTGNAEGDLADTLEEIEAFDSEAYTSAKRIREELKKLIESVDKIAYKIEWEDEP